MKDEIRLFYIDYLNPHSLGSPKYRDWRDRAERKAVFNLWVSLPIAKEMWEKYNVTGDLVPVRRLCL